MKSNKNRSVGKPFPKIIAHRGLAKGHIENTIPAFKAAIAAGADMIELDAHETCDRRFIVYHDPSMEADAPAWSSLSYPRIRELLKGDNRAPLLSDCLGAIGGIPVNIEVKSCLNSDDILVALRNTPPCKGSVISSFDYRLLASLRRKGAWFPLFLNISISRQQTWMENIRNASFCILPGLLPKFLAGVSMHYPLLHRVFVRRVQGTGAMVFVWTVDSPENWKKFASWGVDGIITNAPDRLAAAYARFASSSIRAMALSRKK
jgi:glycerophosphoryl diester phosphodiesterase